MGYRFYPGPRPTSPGHSRLDIVMLQTPSGQHFDPERVQLWVAGPQGVTCPAIYHPFQSSTCDYRVVIGRIVMLDRNHKQVRAFSFGGHLHVEAALDRTVCQITSAAPIIDIAYGQDPETLLVEEVEALLARRRMAVLNLEQRLSEYDPLELYAACLEAAVIRLAPVVRVWDTPPLARLLWMVRAEIRALTASGEWPARPCELLAG
jgi:hypothetical protein